MTRRGNYLGGWKKKKEDVSKGRRDEGKWSIALHRNLPRLYAKATIARQSTVCKFTFYPLHETQSYFRRFVVSSFRRFVIYRYDSEREFVGASRVLRKWKEQSQKYGTCCIGCTPVRRKSTETRKGMTCGKMRHRIAYATCTYVHVCIRVRIT